LAPTTSRLTASMGRGAGRRELAAVTVKAFNPGRFGVAETVTTRSATEPASVRSTADAAASVAEEGCRPSWG
jgi:hypothetical protein